MKFRDAFTWMKHGKSMRTSGFKGYWLWDAEKKTIIMVTKNNERIDLRATNDLDFTLGFVLSDAWEFYEGHDDPRQNDLGDTPLKMGMFYTEHIDDTAPMMYLGDGDVDVSDFKQLWETPTDIIRDVDPLREALDLAHFYIDATEQEIVDHGFVDRGHVLEEARLQRERLGQDGSNASYIQPLITGKRPIRESVPPNMIRPFEPGLLKKVMDTARAYTGFVGTMDEYQASLPPELRRLVSIDEPTDEQGGHTFRIVRSSIPPEMVTTFNDLSLTKIDCGEHGEVVGITRPEDGKVVLFTTPGTTDRGYEFTVVVPAWYRDTASKYLEWLRDTVSDSATAHDAICRWSRIDSDQIGDIDHVVSLSVTTLADVLGKEVNNAIPLLPIDVVTSHPVVRVTFNEEKYPSFEKNSSESLTPQSVSMTTEIPNGAPGSLYTCIHRGDQGSITILNAGKDRTIKLVSTDDDVSGNKSLPQLITAAHVINGAVDSQSALFIWGQNGKHIGLSLTPSPLYNTFTVNEVKALQQLGDYHPTDMVLLVTDK